MTTPLERHLAAWLGQWPPTAPLTVVTAPGRAAPGWDGQVQPVLGVASPDGTVLSVPSAVLTEVRRLAAAGGLSALGDQLGPLVGMPAARLNVGVFRWSERPADLPDLGVWLAWNDRRVPRWLHPFGGQELVALVDGQYAAGVGIKPHDRFGQELAVGTDEGHRGRGLARRLVAQAARRVIAGGSVPTYLHDTKNLASARVAEAAGFPDRGWQVLAMWGPA